MMNAEMKALRLQRYKSRKLVNMVALMLSLMAMAFGLFWLIAMGAAQYGFTHVEAGRAAVLVVIELLVAVLTAAWFGDRELGLREWLGGALVLAAALMAARPTVEFSSSYCEAKS